MQKFNSLLLHYINTEFIHLLTHVFQFYVGKYAIFVKFHFVCRGMSDSVRHFSAYISVCMLLYNLSIH